MHRHDRCSADDLYFGAVRGHACHFALFILLSKVTKRETFVHFNFRWFLTRFSGEGWGGIMTEARPNYPLKWY